MKSSGQQLEADIPKTVSHPKCAVQTLFNNSSQNKRKSFKAPLRAETHGNSSNACSEMNEVGRTSNSNPSNDRDAPTHPRSPYHNFQKHMVVMIRKLSKGLASQLGNSAAETVAKQMWNIFLTSGLKSKKIVTILFGQAQLGQQKYRRLLLQCYFGQLCHESEAVVREAQAILRSQAVMSLQEGRVADYATRNSHIKSKNQFCAYLNEFLQQLRAGPLKRFRISTEASSRLLEAFGTASTLEQPNLNISEPKDLAAPK